ncbi:phage protease [Pseudorhodobacter sp. E13]|uniref:phage protease n=1 Tax=Pseudorhodobacter sp. E13 TaxID=2487931 RepID=UPI00131545E1|nr:phage protease [Pseudorhodobacter sp. E13]
MPLDLPAEAGIPEWVHLLPGGGTVHTGDHRGPYRVTSLQSIIATSGAVKLPIDENHSIDIAGPRGEPSPARGHIVELQARDDGLWGRVEWNASGRALMEEKAYLGISPVITHDPAKNITGVLRASLTNRPNLRGLTALHSEENAMSFAAFAKALGLGDDAGEEDILAAIKKLSGGSKDATALQSTISDVGVALGVDQDAPASAVLMAAKLAKQGDAALSQQVTALQSQLDGLLESNSRKAAEAFVDGERNKGATAVNEQTRDDLVALHMTNPQTAEKLIKGAPYIKPREGSRDNPALQSDQGDLVSRAKAYQAAHEGITWTDAVLAISEGKQ